MRLTRARALLVSLLLISFFIPRVYGLTAFTDGFEAGGAAWDDLWDGNGATNWQQGTAGSGEAAHSPHTGTYDAWGTTGDTVLISDDINLSGVSSASLTFWYYLDDNEAADLTLLLWDGVVYDTIAQIGGGTESTWLQYTIASLNSQYFISNFRIRFTSVLGTGENVFVDDVLVTYVTTSEYSRAASQSVTWGGSVSKSSEFTRSAAQSMTWAGTAARVLEFSRAASQGVTWGGATLSELIYGRVASQSIGWSSGASYSLEYVRGAVQSLTWNGTITRALDVGRAAQQTLNTTLSTGRATEMFRTAAQSIVTGLSGWGGMGYLYNATASLILYIKTMDPPLAGSGSFLNLLSLIAGVFIFLTLMLYTRRR